ncbi:MAG: DUF454 domain-containing protein [Chloroflexi bacterium]|nr:DUF454 domain-containing protein [Chloroflexota bacterium]
MWRKRILVLTGVLSLALGIVGVFLPLVPTTPFLLLAAACFARSSEQLYRWLMHHKVLGPYIRCYREHKAITLRAKLGTLFLLWGTILYSAAFVVDTWLVRGVLGAVALGVTVHILSLRTLSRQMLNECQLEQE